MEIEKVREALKAATLVLQAVEQADEQLKEIERRRDEVKLEISQLQSSTVQAEKQKADANAAIKTLTQRRQALETVVKSIQEQIAQNELALRNSYADNLKRTDEWNKKIEALKAEHATALASYQQFKKAVGL